MTLSDFKMWLSGYSENIAEAPTPAQWKRIQEALASIGDIKPLLYDPMRGMQGGAGTPPTDWIKGISSQAAIEADRQRRMNNNQTVEVR